VLTCRPHLAPVARSLVRARGSNMKRRSWLAPLFVRTRRMWRRWWFGAGPATTEPVVRSDNRQRHQHRRRSGQRAGDRPARGPSRTERLYGHRRPGDLYRERDDGPTRNRGPSGVVIADTSGVQTLDGPGPVIIDGTGQQRAGFNFSNSPELASTGSPSSARPRVGS